MPLVFIVLLSAVLLSVAYFTYGPVLARLLRLDPDKPTPAIELRDDVDYVPIEPNSLLSQHFSAIAAAGPVVGPIVAGALFGWLPALLWILVGSILIGGVHDITALVASIRHKARSIAEVVQEHMSKRAYLLFLIFVWLALVYIIVAFTDVTASSFVGTLDDGQTVADSVGMVGGTALLVAWENGKTTVSGGGIATSSVLYLVLPVIMGLLLKYTDLSVGWATVIFLPLVGVAIWLGQLIPLDLQSLLGGDAAMARKVWNVLLILYCAVASVIPMWLLLQPRGHLGGYFLYVVLAAAVLGIFLPVVLGTTPDQSAVSLQYQSIQYPAFRGWDVSGGDGKLNRNELSAASAKSVPLAALSFADLDKNADDALTADEVPEGQREVFRKSLGAFDTEGSMTPLFPILFITIACGACSGFHAIIASGTTSKQLERETDARSVGYGSMLLEGMVAVVSLVCVMMLAPDNPLVANASKVSPNTVYAHGIASFMSHFFVPQAFAISFGLMAFTTFVYDTLDVCTRLGRYILQELTGLDGTWGIAVGTTLTAGVPLLFLVSQGVGADGKPFEAWRTYWNLFGASNQLLAALTLLGVTVWLWRTYREWWVWPVTGLPCVLMYVMSMWALTKVMWPAVAALQAGTVPDSPVPYVATILVLLGGWLLVEALIAIVGQFPPAPEPEKSSDPKLATGGA